MPAACCGGPLLIAVLAAAGALAWGGLGLAVAAVLAGTLLAIRLYRRARAGSGASEKRGKPQLAAPAGSAAMTPPAGAAAGAGKMPSHQSGHRSYSSAIAIRTRRRCLPVASPDAVLAQLRSRDARVRVKALHRICPCRAGFPLYERFRSDVKRLQKDPDPGVRVAALHVEHDACEIETIEAGLDRAAEQGWRYSDAGWVSKHRQRQVTGHWLPL